MKNADTKEMERNTEILIELTGGDPVQMKKDIGELGAQGLFSSIETLIYPEEVIQKIKDMDELLKITEELEEK